MTMTPVLHSFAYCLDYLREQVADVAEADMVAQPNGIMNHPAWVVGHLTHACQMLGGVVGVSKWLPNDWARRFGTGSVPVADASLYGTKSEALATLTDAQSRSIPNNPSRADPGPRRPHRQPHRPTFSLAPRHGPATDAPIVRVVPQRGT